MSEAKKESKPTPVIKEGDPKVCTKALEARLDALEKQNELIIEGFEWAANQVRPMFGQGALAVIFDGIAEGLKKSVGPKS